MQKLADKWGKTCVKTAVGFMLAGALMAVPLGQKLTREFFVPPKPQVIDTRGSPTSKKEPKTEGIRVGEVVAPTTLFLTAVGIIALGRKEENEIRKGILPK